MGGFGSLGDISSGPSLPDIGLSATPGAALDDAEVLAADLAPPSDVVTPPASAGGALASADPPASSLPATGGGAPGASGQGLSGRIVQPERQSAPRPGGVPPPTIPTGPPAGNPAPAEDLGEVTRGLGEAMREPLEPLTNAILELLRGPPGR